MRLAIVGSSELSDKQCKNVEWLVGIIVAAAAIRYHDDLVIVSGGARGVDTIVAEAAQEWDIRRVEYRPQVKRWEGEWTPADVNHRYPRKFLRGFRDRNLQIVEDCDTLISIRSITSKTYGSGWTADRAEEAGKEVIRLYV